MRSAQMAAARMTMVVVATALVAAGCGATDQTEGRAAPFIDEPSTTTEQPTTTTVKEWSPLPTGPNVTSVASAIVPQLSIHRDLPPGAAAAGVEVVDRSTWPEQSSGSRAYNPLPSIEEGVGGRFLTETGWVVDSPTDFGNPAVFVITEDRGQWLKVQVPSRPQGSEGWVNRDHVEVSSHEYRVEVDVGDRRLRLVNRDEVLLDEPVVVGAPDTPTPTGRFYVTDFVAKQAGGSFGPWVLPVSAFSEEMDWFSYGVPVIALHGTNKPQLVGSAASNGCIRMPDGTITLLRETIPLGTPVVVSA